MRTSLDKRIEENNCRENNERCYTDEYYSEDCGLFDEPSGRADRARPEDIFRNH
jgi:hypothetical protein